MEERDIHGILKLIVKRLENHFIVWRLDGSANLRVQGLDVPFSALEMRTNAEGLRVFKTVLKEFFTREEHNEDSEGDIVYFTLQGVELTVINNRYNLLHRVKKVHWRELDLPVFPLKEARAFYVALGKEKLDAIIDRHEGVGPSLEIPAEE